MSDSEQELRDIYTEVFAHRIRSVLDSLRVQGWEFPTRADVGVSILSNRTPATLVAVRMDDVRVTARVRANPDDLSGDVAEAAEAVAVAWLAEHATGRTVPPRMRRGAAA